MKFESLVTKLQPTCMITNSFRVGTLIVHAHFLYTPTFCTCPLFVHAHFLYTPLLCTPTHYYLVPGVYPQRHAHDKMYQALPSSLQFLKKFFLYIGLLGMTQLTRKLQLALRLILRGSRDRRLNVPSEANLLLNFWGRAECTQKRKKSLLQVGLEPWTFRSAVQCFNQ